MPSRKPSAQTRIQAGDLGFFSALAAAGSLSAAARELGISTPAVSKHLATMEARVGLPLVNRSTRRMSLTPGASRSRSTRCRNCWAWPKPRPRVCCASTPRWASGAAMSRP